MPSAGLAIVAVIMSVQIVATMSPTASEQFGKIASIAVIMTLLPYIYSAISIKVLGYKKMSQHEYTLYALIALVAAIYSLWAIVGSNGEQTRWSLIFVVTTIVFYSLALNHKRDVEEHRSQPGGRAPRWIRYATLAITIVALALMFWKSLGEREFGALLTRSPAPPISRTVDPATPPTPAPAAPAAQ